MTALRISNLFGLLPIARAAAFALACLLPMLAGGIAHAQGAAPERRVALLIANANYDSRLNQLAYARDNAQILARGLEDVGFEVRILYDANLDEMNQAIDALIAAASQPDLPTVAVLYFAGHAASIAGVPGTYLLPSNVDINGPDRLAGTSVSVSRAAKALSDVRPKRAIILLDGYQLVPRPWVSPRLQQLVPPDHVQVAYSGEQPPGAPDPADLDRTLFIRAVAQALQIAELPASQLFDEVEAMITAETEGRREPWSSFEVGDPFTFSPAGGIDTRVAGVPAPVQAPSAVAGDPGAISGDVVPIPVDRPRAGLDPANRLQFEEPARTAQAPNSRTIATGTDRADSTGTGAAPGLTSTLRSASEEPQIAAREPASRIAGTELEDTAGQAAAPTAAQRRTSPQPTTAQPQTGTAREDKGAARIQPGESEMDVWNRIKESDDPNDFVAFLETFPNSLFSSVARVRRDRLAAASAREPSATSGSSRRVEIGPTVTNNAPVSTTTSTQTPGPSGGFRATRDLTGPDDTWSNRYGAVGMVAFTNRPIPTNPRDQAICTAFNSVLLSEREAASLGVQPSEMIATLWPVADAGTLRDAGPPWSCDELLDNYHLGTSLIALDDAMTSQTIGTSPNLKTQPGPFLIAWAPRGDRGARDAAALVMDLSDARTDQEILTRFRLWRDRVEANPALWRGEGFTSAKFVASLGDVAESFGTWLVAILGSPARAAPSQ